VNYVLVYSVVNISPLFYAKFNLTDIINSYKIIQIYSLPAVVNNHHPEIGNQMFKEIFELKGGNYCPKS